MGKRLAPILALLAMWIPVAGYALGLGNITMNSALNQPLDAEIELLSVKEGDLDDLKIRLGSQEDFDRVGAERSFFLTKIKFSIDKNAEGQPYIRLTSPAPVTEPFLDFVVEARWPRGRVLREFTVLVDPPALVEEAPAPVSRPTTTATAPVQRPAPEQPAPRQMAPVTEAPQPEPDLEPAPESVFVKRTIDDDAFFQRAPDSGGSRFTADEESAFDRLAMNDDEFSYTVVRDDTLWEIADQLRPDDVSVNQMMLYLVRQNPNAFFNNNINELKAGYVLRIDDPSRLDDVSVADANTEVKRQMSEWQARKSGLVPQADSPVAGEIERGTEGPASTETTASEDKASLKLVAPGSGTAAGGTGAESPDQMQEDLLLAAEALEASQKETEELKSRLTQMEEQLAAMQRLIALKDDEMALLQQQLSGEKVTSEELAAKAAAAEEAAKEAAAAEAAAKESAAKEAAAADAATKEAAAAKEAAAKEAAAKEAAAAEAQAAKDEMQAMKSDASTQESAPAAETKAKADAKEKAAPKKPIKVVPPPPPETGIVDTIMAMVSDGITMVSDVVGDPMALLDNQYALYGVGVLVLLIVVVFVIRRRRMTTSFEESILNVNRAPSDNSPPASSEDNVPLGGESSMVSDFAMSQMSGMSGIQEDAADVDPISEADVYLAYGRHQQAEDIIREAISETPDRHELRLKMLEIHFAAKNKDAFEAEAKELHDLLGDESDPLWSKAVTMGAQLCPENELFGGVSSDALQEELASDTSDEDLLDLDFDLDNLGGDDDSSNDLLAEIDAITSGGMDDLAAESAAAKQAAAEDLDMDVAAAAEEPAATEEEDSGLDFDVSGLDFGGSESEEETETVADASDDNSLDFDLGDMDTGAEEAESDAGLDMSLDDTTVASSEGAEVDDVFSEVDEVGTKLDLARAYVDMGDSDGARGILSEVLEEGDDDQKSQAQELLEQIG